MYISYFHCLTNSSLNFIIVFGPFRNWSFWGAEYYLYLYSVIFGKPNDIRIRSLLGSRIIIVFVFAHLWSSANHSLGCYTCCFAVLQFWYNTWSATYIMTLHNQCIGPLPDVTSHYGRKRLVLDTFCLRPVLTVRRIPDSVGSCRINM